MSGRRRPPLILAPLDRRLADRLTADGWRLHEGFRPSGPWDLGGMVCWGPVDDPESAADALEAAGRGAGLVLTQLPDAYTDTVLDDCRRLGLVPRPAPKARVEPDWAPLLDLLVEGLSIEEAARRCHLSPRSAYRRLHQARQELDATSTTAAVVAWRRRRRAEGG